MNKFYRYTLRAMMVGVVLLLWGGNVQAATSDAMAARLLTDASESKYGSAYDPPFVVPEGNVDSGTGAVRVRERDLYLPGKSGLDLEIYREYSSYDSNRYYTATLYSAAREKPRSIGIPYEMTLNGKTSIIYVASGSEENIAETLTTRIVSVENPKTQIVGEKRISYVTVLTQGDEVTLYWRKDIAPEIIWGRVTGQLGRSSLTKGCVNLQNGWRLNIPSITYIAEAERDRGDAMVYKRFAELCFEDGTRETLQYTLYYYFKTSDTPSYTTVENALIKDGSKKYQTVTYDTPVEDERGFTYNIKITNIKGKTYYFYMENLTKISGSMIGLLQAVEDRFGNMIRYEKTENGWTITDTYGRIITVSAEGICVQAGNMIKRIDYINETERDMQNNPYGYYYTYDKHKLTVREYTGSNNTGGVKDTVYTMKNREMRDNYSYYDLNWLTIPLLQKIQYPTGAQHSYTYEDIARMVQYASLEDSGGDYEVFRVIGEKLEDCSGSSSEMLYDKAYTYTGKWEHGGTYMAPEWGQYRTFTTNQTLENGHTKTLAQSYDSMGRLVLEEVRCYGGSKTEKEEYEYHYYNGGVEKPDSPSRAQMSAARRGVLRSVTYTRNNKWMYSTNSDYNYIAQKPTLIQKGEYKMMASYGDYAQPTIKIENRKDAADLKTVNTLTADKKQIAKTQIYDGTTLKNTINYTYFPDGTLQSTTETGDGGSRTTEYAYQYAADGSYRMTITAKNVLDADGQSRDVTTAAEFDSLGRKKAETDGNGNVTHYEYDMLGQMTKKINPDNTAYQIAYDIPNNIVTETDENGTQISRDYSATGNLLKIYQPSNPNRPIAEYAYDKEGRRTLEAAYMEIGGRKISKEYTYDDLDRVLTKTSKNAQDILDVETNTYDVTNDTITSFSLERENRDIDVSAYDKAEVRYHNMKIKKKYSAGERHVYLDNTEVVDELYDCMDDLTEVYDLKGVSSLRIGIGYGSGQVTVRLYPEGDARKNAGGAMECVTTTYQGDETYVPPTTVTNTDSFGNVLSKSYYRAGSAQTDANLLNKEEYQYDYQGRVLQSLTGRTYMENLGDYTQKTEYDYAGNAIKTYRADGSYRTASYDNFGNKSGETDYMGNATSYQYDGLGRVIRTNYPVADGVTGENLTYYDNNGNTVKQKQQNNAPGTAKSYATTEMEYDGRNRVTAVKQNDGTRDIYTQYAYDAVGNTIKTVSGQTQKISDLNGVLPSGVMAETCEYDRFGYPSKKTDSLGQTEEMRYNLMGLLRYAVDKEGREQYYDYTAYGSLAQRGDDDGLYAYRHSRNNLLKKAFHYGHDEEIDYTYDELGYLQSEEDATYRREYTNDVNGNRKSMILKKKQGNAWTQLQRIDYIYDKLDRLWRVNVNNHETDQWYNYDANNRVTREGYFQSRSLVGALDYTYNHAGWITGISETDGIPYTQSYDYRLDGNMIRKTDSRNGSETQYRYDAMGQLLAEELRVNGATTETVYAYDTHGNRISKNEDGVISYDTYDANNRLIRESREEDGITTVQNYSYDKVGNLLQRATGTLSAPGGAAELQLSAVSEGMADDLSGAEVVNYMYNANNLLTGIATDQGLMASYAYDVQGRRISKTVNGSTTHQIWDGQNIVREETAAGAEHNYYYSRRLFAKKTGDEILRYLYDGHGSVIGLDNVDDYDYDEDGNVIDHNNGDRYDYDAFGNLRSVTGETYNPFRYCGEYMDAESGLIYLRNRYYDPQTGRFITEDPAKDGTNWYVYCGNNPVMFVDPSGLIPTASEAADMADHIYKDIPLSDANDPAGNKALRTVAGWRLIDVYSKGSFKMGVYIRDGDDWRNPSEYVLANKGTSAVNDWDDNLLQPLGGSGDMKLSLDTAKWFSDSHANQEITFVGHSKGGGEAMANAVATNRNAITFNPAKANLAVYSETKNTRKSYTGTMTHYVVEGEILNDKFGNPSMGTTVKLPTQVAIEPWTFAAWGQRTDNHHMWAVKAALKEAGY